MITDKCGVSALGIQRQLGIARYETAWMILHKLRRATVNLERTRLTGEVEVDETWIGGYQPGGKGRTRKGRRAALVVMALEVGNGYPERLRARLVPDDTSASLIGFIKDVVEPGSVIITDGFQSYRAVPAAGYTHRRIVEGSGDAFTNPVPHLHQAIGNLKAWLNGTHRGVTRRHLAVYLDEFVFRHNRRLNLAAAFQTLLGLGTGRGPTTYDTINGAKDLPKVPFTPSKKVARAASSREAVASGDTGGPLGASSQRAASETTAQNTGG